MEIRSSTGALNFGLVTPDIIGELDEPRKLALLALMEANRATDAAVARRNAANKRVYDAIADEEAKRLAHKDASSPIPFTTAEIERQLGRPLIAVEMQEAREKHDQRVRALLEAQARRAAIDAYNSNH